MRPGSGGEQRPTDGRRRLLLGLALVAIAWPANWLWPGMRTHLLFFPLWLGYILTVDGLTLLRTGSSILTRSRLQFIALFALSVPVWWLFELLNERLQNWEYVGRDVFGPLEYALWSSVSFSTVMPAVLGTAELVRSFAWIERRGSGPVVRPTRALLRALPVIGLVLLALMLLWPRLFYPFLWMSGVFLLEPVNRLLGRGSLLDDLEEGDWRAWMSLWIGTLICGFFWEMWNYWSDPKWIYHVPGAAFLHVFEMPILGYLGYLPFALQLYLLQALFLPRATRLAAAERERPAPSPRGRRQVG